jgi:Flp pilus assembly pilin Flp
MKALINFLKNEDGSVMMEYTVVTTLIGGGCIGVMGTMRDGQVDRINDLNETLDGATP